ncbi:MAG: HAD family hydrolase [Clostridia bacterium]|nr:HAD family hydrolase [Clostridia bacterium]
MIETILFDLDGTLLPMEQENFVKAYFGSLAKKLAPYGFAPEKLVESIWAGMKAMVTNSTEEKNEARWWETFDAYFGELSHKHRSVLEEYYAKDFDKVRHSCGHNPAAAELVRELKARGYRVVLATNPVFPAMATEQRAGWAGLNIADFDLITTYENSTRCKPNPEYYTEILTKIGAKAEECMMVGNDVAEDMIAETLGMKVFLLTDNLLNKKELDISTYRKGSFGELLEYINELENT